MLIINIVEWLILIIGIPLVIFLWHIKSAVIASAITGLIILVLFRFFVWLIGITIAYIFEDFPRFVKIIYRIIICFSIVIQLIIIIATILITMNIAY